MKTPSRHTRRLLGRTVSIRRQFRCHHGARLPTRRQQETDDEFIAPVYPSTTLTPKPWGLSRAFLECTRAYIDPRAYGAAGEQRNNDVRPRTTFTIPDSNGYGTLTYSRRTSHAPRDSGEAHALRPGQLPSRIHDTGSRERPSTDPMRRREHDPPKAMLRTSIFDVINLTRAKYVPIRATIARNDTGSNATSRLPGQRLTVVPSKTLSPSIYLHVYNVFKPSSASRNSKDPSHHHTSATNYAPHDPQHCATPSSIIANLGHPDIPYDTAPRN